MRSPTLASRSKAYKRPLCRRRRRRFDCFGCCLRFSRVGSTSTLIRKPDTETGAETRVGQEGRSLSLHNWFGSMVVHPVLFEQATRPRQRGTPSSRLTPPSFARHVAPVHDGSGAQKLASQLDDVDDLLIVPRGDSSK